jgi:hypothetical protein
MEDGADYVFEFGENPLDRLTGRLAGGYGEIADEPSERFVVRGGLWVHTGIPPI